VNSGGNIAITDKKAVIPTKPHMRHLNGLTNGAIFRIVSPVVEIFLPFPFLLAPCGISIVEPRCVAYLCFREL